MTPEEAAAEAYYTLATAAEAYYTLATDDAAAWCEAHDFPAVAKALRAYRHRDAARGADKWTVAGWPGCSTCDGGGCRDCTERADK